MGRLVRILEGRFGRLALSDLAPGESCAAQTDPAVVMQPGDGDLVFLNPGETFSASAATRVLALHAATGWLSASFPAVFGGHDARPFSQPRDTRPPRKPGHADPHALAV